MDILNRLAAGIKGGLAARLIAAVLFYAALEGVIFHSGLYALHSNQETALALEGAEFGVIADVIFGLIDIGGQDQEHGVG